MEKIPLQRRLHAAWNRCLLIMLLAAVAFPLLLGRRGHVVGAALFGAFLVSLLASYAWDGWRECMWHLRRWWWVRQAGGWYAHLDRCRQHVICPHCGYDLRATPDRCPECGTDAPLTDR